jgi:hypothetical protein
VKNVLHALGREEVKTFTLYPPSTITDGERRARRTIAGVAGPQPVFPAGFMTTFEVAPLSWTPDLLSLSRGPVRSGDKHDPTEGFRFVSENQAAYPIATMCRLLGVSPSGYYAWMKREPSRRRRMDTALVAEICASHGTYGAPRIHAYLAAKGIRVGRKRVARLMSVAGLAGEADANSSTRPFRAAVARHRI